MKIREHGGELKRDYREIGIPIVDVTIQKDALIKNLRSYLYAVRDKGMPGDKDIDLVRASISLLALGKDDSDYVANAMNKYCVEYESSFTFKSAHDHMTKGYEFSLMPSACKIEIMNRYSKAVIGTPLIQKAGEGQSTEK